MRPKAVKQLWRDDQPTFGGWMGSAGRIVWSG